MTTRHVVTLDGERHEIQPASTGTVEVPKAVGEWLIANTAVEPYADSDSETDDGE